MFLVPHEGVPGPGGAEVLLGLLLAALIIFALRWLGVIL
jgi:hypothetical protein